MREIIVDHNNALGTTPTIASNDGGLTLNSGITLPSLTVNGNINIKSDITTTGAQTYNNDVQILSAASVSGPMVNERFNSVTLAIENDNKTIDWKTFTTDGADITFNGRLYAEQLKRGSDEDYYYPKLGDHYNKDNYDAIDPTKDPMTSAKIRTCLVANTCASGEVAFNGGSGFRFVFKDQLMPDDLEGDLNDYNLYKEVNLNENLYRLDVRANTININSNIMT